MSPNIDKYSAGISVNCPEQSPQRIVKADDKNTRTERLQKFRHEPHPQFFARADHENGEQQNDQIALQPKKIRDPSKP